MGTTQQKDFLLKVALGEVDGYSHINKFGHNPATTSTDDIWGGLGVYAFYPTTAQTVQAVSTDVDDNSSGNGARTMQVYGLDANWEEQEEMVTLNGTTPVVLSNTYIRLYRAIVLTAGSTLTNEGDISIGVSGGDVGAFIGTGDGQTQQAIYTIPAGKTAYFLKGYVGISDDDKNGEVAEFQWMIKTSNGTDGAWAVKGEMACNNVGSGHWQYEYAVPAGPLPEKTDIRIRVVTATATIGTVGGFDLLLKDN